MKRRAWLTIGAVLVGGAGAVTYAIADPAAKPDDARAARKPAVHTVKLKDKGAGRKGLDKQGTDRYSAVMLTWDNPHAQLKGTPEVRYRATETGDWSAWQKVAGEEFSADGAEAERAGTRGGTASVWTDDADGLEVRVVNADGTLATGLPAGLDVKLLDPGTDPKGTGEVRPEPAAYAEDITPTPTATDAQTPGDPATTTPTPTSDAPTPTDSVTGSPTESPSESPTASPSPSDTVPAPRPSTVVKPPIITQAEWGASTDYDGTPGYGAEIKAAVVHHTGVNNDNTISCGQSRARMRTIQQEHFSRGYYDLGYNFVVDKCGQIFEGRSGGMDLPVIGAHDVGFNTNTVGISFIGNYETAKPSRAGLEAISRIVAWKFGMYGIDPNGQVTLTSGTAKGQDGNLVEKGTSITLPRVFGHRDTNATACPGANLYPKLAEIRRYAASAGRNSAVPTADFDRDGITDLVAGVPRASGNVGNVVVVPGGLDGPVAGAKVRLTQSSAGVPGSSETGDNWGASTAWGDINGDGHADLAIGAPGEDDTSGNADRGSVTVLYGPGLNSGSSYTTSGVTAAGAKLGSAVTVGDFNADGKADVFAAGTGKGGNWNVHLTGGATQYGTLTTATGGVAYPDAATGDFNRDGYADVALNYRDTSGIGRVTWFKGSAAGLAKVSTISVKGGRSLAAGDVNGNGYDDIVIGQPYAGESGGASGGQVTMVPGTSTGFTTTGMRTVYQDTTGVPGANESGDAMGWSVSVGDYNLDGYADVLTGLPNEDITRSGTNQANAGTALLLKGTSTGLTGSGALSFHQDTSGITGWTEPNDKFGSSVVLQDLSGWGRADLAIGAEGENGYDGTILQLDSGSAGIDTTKGVYYGRDGLGTPGGAHLGQTLTP
ncbi:FG-GAP-like repeat-containing protein [Streptomyces sp. NBC_00286]|uniref:FG-GAP-like repeat-containing protein n=1 Tax=Streptomyces sp. NBC_00286 TaxID=2975701 RepID=UPI002E27ECCA|nr:FG-GAP-like repeat-containing protein [Streptomyces sp. NBC_00286]